MRYLKHNTSSGKDYKPHAGYAVPFFVALAILTVVSFIIPLRPTQSYSEKRNLAEFPEFSMEALSSGSYFDDITTWFSDTFPGRESWLNVSSSVSELHGWSDIVIHGDIQMGDQIPSDTEPEGTLPPAAETQNTEPAGTEPTGTGATETAPADTEPTETEPPETIVLQETTPPTVPVEHWGGVDAGDGAEVYLGSVIQIGNSAFNYFSFSEYTSGLYINMLNDFVASMEGLDVNIIHAPAPTAIGIMVENDYMAKLKCARQDEVVEYINSRLNERVVTVDSYNALIDHNDEYIYFRTDHHWTALGAYYVYEAICEAMGYEAAPLDSFEQWDQGVFEGSLYYKCNQSSKLELDNVIAYQPQGDIVTMMYNENGYGFEWPLLTDMTKSNRSSKYMTFIAGDRPLTVITNNSLPDAPDCVVIKESYGNCFVPFLTQNYHTVYVVDYREYRQMGLKAFVEQYGIQDIIFIPNLGATQSQNVVSLLDYLTR